MAISVFDLFKIGIGPSSSHTVGPMRAAKQFIHRLQREQRLGEVAQVKVELFGSLGATGKGHGSDTAVMLGLLGENPDTTDPDLAPQRIAEIRQQQQLWLAGTQAIRFVESEHLQLHKRKSLPFHPNGMQFFAYNSSGECLAQRTFYSVGGGFIVDEAAVADGLPRLRLKFYPTRFAQDKNCWHSVSNTR